VRDTRLLLISALAPVLWGTGYLVIAEAFPPGRPLLAGAARALPAGLLLLALTAVLARGRVLPRGAWWWRSAVLGLLNIGLFFALLSAAAFRLPGGIAAVLGAVGPFLVAGFAYPLLRERPAGRTLVAGAIGLTGVSLLVLRATVGLDPIGLAAAAAAVVTMSLGTVLGRRWGIPPGYDRPRTAVLAVAGWQLTAGGLLLAPLTLLIEGPVPVLSPANLIGMAYLSIVVTAVAHVLWFQAVTALASTRVTMLTLISPLTAAALGWAVLGQSLSAGQLAGAAAVLGAVILGATARPVARVAPAVVAPACAVVAPAPAPA
jgi:probable blue pigment (indigoidine) exporter